MKLDPATLDAIVRPRRVTTSSIGGLLRSEPEDFDVEEIPAYTPEGEGDHLFLWVEKRAFPTEAVGRELAKSLRVSVSEIGFAGLKDTVAVTRQFVSVPRQAADDAGWNWRSSPNALGGDRFRILSVTPHGNKLRTGHLRGNRFRIVLRPEKSWSDEEIQIAREAVAQVMKIGLPNYYGEQRFGRGGSTVDLGLELLRSQKNASDERRPSRRVSRNLKRLALSAVQSAVFNLVVSDRLERGDLVRAQIGDVFQVCASGGPFLVADPEVEQPRLDRREVVPAGPMFGKKMKPSAGVVRDLELSALERMGLDESSFDIPGKLLLGTRRPMLVWPSPEVHGDAEGIVLTFDLPKGSYATVLLREITG